MWRNWTAHASTACAALPGLLELAQGGTTVGTGLNAPVSFASRDHRAESPPDGTAFVPAADVQNDKSRRCRLRKAPWRRQRRRSSRSPTTSDCSPAAITEEVVASENDPGSSIMPGKEQSGTQVEAVTQVCDAVFWSPGGGDVRRKPGDTSNSTCSPLIAHAVIESVHLLADAARSFATCVLSSGLQPRQALAAGIERSLMLVTALAPLVGYDRAAHRQTACAPPSVDQERHQGRRNPGAVRSAGTAGADGARLRMNSTFGGGAVLRRATVAIPGVQEAGRWQGKGRVERVIDNPASARSTLTACDVMECRVR